MDFTFLVLAGTDLASFGCDATDIPIPIPEYFVTDLLYLFSHFCVFSHIFHFPFIGCKLCEFADCPVMKERYHSTFSTAQIQAVIPVCTQSFTDSILTYLSAGEIKNLFHMLIYSTLTAICICINLIQERKLTGFFHILIDGCHKPQCIIRTGILYAMDHIGKLRCGNYSRRLKWFLSLFCGIKPLRLKKMKSIPFFYQTS